jgi:hypothetical protein
MLAASTFIMLEPSELKGGNSPELRRVSFLCPAACQLRGGDINEAVIALGLVL